MRTKSSAAAPGPEAANIITTYTPAKPAAELWASHGDLVRDRVRAAAPDGAESARRLVSAGAGLLAWAWREGVPLRDEVLFSDESIERYIVVGLGGPENSRATIRSRLRRLRDAGRAERSSRLGHRRVRPPYSKDELVGLWRLVCNQPTPERARRLQGLYCLSLGAGCASEDLRHVAGTSVRTADGVVLVDIGGPRRRTVPVLAGVGEHLVGLAEVAGKGLVVGGNQADADLVNRLVQSTSGGEDLARLEVSRLRHSWMVAMMQTPIPLPVLSELAGISTLRTFEDLVPFCQPSDRSFETEISAALEAAWL